MSDQAFLQVQQLADAHAAGNRAAVQRAFIALLDAPNAAAKLRALDSAQVLTQIIPELEAARATQQPSAHFLPVLAHSLEAVAAVDWLLEEIKGPEGKGQVLSELPEAIQAHPDLRFRSAYRAQLCEHFASIDSGAAARPALFKLAALLHDNAKPQTKQTKPTGEISFYDHPVRGAIVALDVGRRLGLSQQATNYVALIVREHMRPGQLGSSGEVTPRAVRRLFRDTGAAGPDVLLHALADHLATRGPRIDLKGWYMHVRWTDALLDELWGEDVPLTQPLLNGKELMAELGLVPGPLVGHILAAVGEAQAGGDVTTREEALALARRVLRNAR